MIESGRERECAWLTSFCKGARNHATFQGTLANGRDLLDRFRVVSGLACGFLAHDERALQRRYADVQRGADNKTYFVKISQRRYDSRVHCVDLTRCQMIVVIALCVLLFNLLALALYLDSKANPQLAQRLNVTTLFWQE